MPDWLDARSVAVGVILGVLIAVTVRAYWDEFREIEEASKWELRFQSPSCRVSALQVSDYATALARSRPHPASVPAAGRRAELHKPRKRRAAPKPTAAAADGEYVRQRITRLLRSHRTLYLQDLAGLMPGSKIATIKALLTVLVQTGVVERCAPARYRLPRAQRN